VQISHHRHTKNEEMEVKYWIKLLLLPRVIFSRTSKAVTKKNIQLVLDDKWDFKIGDFPLRNVVFNKQNNPMPNAPAVYSVKNYYEHFNKTDKKIYRIVQDGNLSKAMNILCQRANPVIPSDQVLQKLQAKFPQEQDYYGYNDTSEELALYDNLLKYSLDKDSRGDDIPAADLRSRINKLKPCVKPGFDQLRNRHVKQMAGARPEPNANETRFVQSLSDIVNIIIRGEEPKQISSILRSNELFAAPKSNNDVRPIGIGVLYRKLAGMCILGKTRAFNEEHFGLLQCAMRKGGMEETIHLIQHTLAERPDLVTFCADGDNAFNRANQRKGLEETRKHCDLAFPHLRNMYLEESQQWYFGLPDNIKSITCKNGYHQGDVLATWAYIMTIQPLLVNIQTYLERNFPNDIHLVKFYVDDGTFVAPHHVMVEIIKLLMRPDVYNTYGYRLKLNKGCILLGKCENSATALTQKQYYEDLGFSPDIVKIHPENDEENEFNIENYGAIVLGVPIGSDDYVRKFFEDKLIELNEVAKLLINYPDLQCRHLLFRYCFTSKVTYLFRTVRPDLSTDFMEGFENLQKDILWSLFDSPRAELDKKYDWMCLRINQGGMGIQRILEVVSAAYVSSVATWMKSSSFKEYIGHFGKPTEDENDQAIASSDLRCWQEFFVHLEKFKIDPDNVRALQQLRKQDLKFGESLQSFLNSILENERIKSLETSMDLKELEWWRNQINDTSGQPLLAYPTMEPYIIRPAEFRTWIKHRYLIPIPSAGAKCDCSAKPELDPYGLHLSCGCNKEGLRTSLHDSVVLELEGLLKYSGFHVQHEERHLFSTLDANNQCRPDITVNNPAQLNYGTDRKPATKVIIDVSFTCVLDGVKDGKIKSAPSREKALKIGSKIKKRHQDKYKHYRDLIKKLPAQVNPPTIWIVPFVFHTTGLLHWDSMKLLEKMVDAAEDSQKIPGMNLITYFKRRLSCCMARNLASVINRRSHSVMSHCDFRRDRSFDVRHVMELHQEF